MPPFLNDILAGNSGALSGLNPQSNPINNNNNQLSTIQALSGLGGQTGALSNLPFSPNGAGSTVVGGAGGGFDINSFLFGGKDQSGALGLGFDFLSGIAEFGLLKDQLNLAEDQFDFQKGFANRNIVNQAKTVNNSLEDRQTARLGSVGDSGVSGTQYEALDSFLDKNRLSEKKIR